MQEDIPLNQPPRVTHIADTTTTMEIPSATIAILIPSPLSVVESDGELRREWRILTSRGMVRGKGDRSGPARLWRGGSSE